MKKYKYSLITILLFGIFSCCKDEPEVINGPIRPLYIPQEVKDYMYFKPGTYWVYEDSSSKQIDSVVVYSSFNTLDTTFENSKIKEINEWFQVNTHSYRDGYDYDYEIHTSWSQGCYAGINRPCFYVKRIKTKPGNYVGANYFFFYEFMIGYSGFSYLSATDARFKMVAIHDSLRISKLLFIKVVEINEIKNITENKQETNFFIAKGNGIIKKEMLDNNIVWNIKRIKIIQ